jgi:hypothetical protein
LRKTSAYQRRYTIVGKVAYSALLERRLDQFFWAIQSFLEQGFSV